MREQVTLDEVLDRLQRVKKSSHKAAMASCPAHADSDPSLSVAEGDTCIILNCFAGCTFEEICKAIGLEPTQLLYERTGSSNVIRKPAWAREAADIKQLNLEREAKE